jgi:2-methylcitrate dehydratase PrpD
LIHEPKFDNPGLKQQAIVEVATRKGDRWSEYVENVRGTPGNPMTRNKVDEKYLNLASPILGKERTRKLAERIWNLEKIGNIRKIRPLLAKSSS